MHFFEPLPSSFESILVLWVEIVVLLLHAGANLNDKTIVSFVHDLILNWPWCLFVWLFDYLFVSSAGATALIQAVQRSHVDMVTLLLLAGAIVYTEINVWRNYVFCLVFSSSTPSLVFLFLQFFSCYLLFYFFGDFVERECTMYVFSVYVFFFSTAWIWFDAMTFAAINGNEEIVTLLNECWCNCWTHQRKKCVFFLFCIFFFFFICVAWKLTHWSLCVWNTFWHSLFSVLQLYCLLSSIVTVIFMLLLLVFVFWWQMTLPFKFCV